MIEIIEVAKWFNGDVHALTPLNLKVKTGEFVTIVGQSGCGKSTLLRIIAGLINPTEGEVNKPEGSKGAFVFQDAALLPWRTVQRNAELLMELENGFSRAKRLSRASSALQQVGLSQFMNHYPHQLSGGMKMRLSLARALVLRPNYLLLDEPLSAVDELTRELLQEEIYALHKKEKFTSILVTHNVSEAVYLSNRVVVLSPRPGKITHIVNIPFNGRNQKLRTSTKFHKLVSDISGKLRS